VLKLSRHFGDAFTIFIDPEKLLPLGPQTIEVLPLGWRGGRVDIGIRANRSIPILRNELIHDNPSPQLDPDPAPVAEGGSDWTGLFYDGAP